MTELVHIHKSKSTQILLSKIQEQIDARSQVETRSGTSTRKLRVEEARRVFGVDPAETLAEIQRYALSLAEAFDERITAESIPLTQAQKDRLSVEFYHLEKLKVQIEALETRYRELVFAHLDETVKKIPGRPASQTPGKVESTLSGPHYDFERRGGGRGDPNLDTVSLRAVLPPKIAAEIYVTINHEPVPAWTEEVFDEKRFGELVNSGKIDLDVVADHLTPGPWRSPSFYKVLKNGDKSDG